MDGQKPGQTIAPQSGQAQALPAADSAEPGSADSGSVTELSSGGEDLQPSPVVAVGAESLPEEPAVQSDQSVPASPWQFTAENTATGQDDAAAAASLKPVVPLEPVEWTASEFIAHHKSAGWYALLALGTVLAAAIVFVLTRDKISTSAIVLAALVLGIFAARKPRVLKYRLDGGGLHIAEKFYDYNLFKSFSVVDEGAFSSILLMPLRRFMPPLSIYFAPEDETKIVDILADRLPLEKEHRDAVDSLMRRIRF